MAFPDPAALAATHVAANTRDRPWTPTEFASLLQRSDTILTGDAASFVLGRVMLDEAEVLTVATAPAHRRRGLARAALEAFMRAAARRGAATCFLEVAEDNAAALALYAATGFVAAGRRPGYYRVPGQPSVTALILRRTSLDHANSTPAQ